MSPRPKSRKPAGRIMAFAEFMKTPRTEQEVESYHACLAALQRMGMVDEALNIVEPPGRAA